MKILILRLSSFGDILQAFAVPAFIKKHIPEAEIHWVVREDFEDLVRAHAQIDKVWVVKRAKGILGLRSLCKTLQQENFTHIYDAHNNVRSHFITALVKAPHFVRFPKHRWDKFLQYQLKIKRNFKTYPLRDFLKPLRVWGMTGEAPAPKFLSEEFLKEVKQKIGEVPYVVMAPSSAWPLKRWPKTHWQQLIDLLPNKRILLLGGSQDQFLSDLKGTHVENWAGRLTLMESCAVTALAQVTISNDTGVLHVADLLAKPAVALIGPVAVFPSRPSTKVMETEIACRPCSRIGSGGCSQTVYQKCLVDITPQSVAKIVEQIG